MKSINKLILFFMLIFISILLTANATMFYASSKYSATKTGTGGIIRVMYAYDYLSYRILPQTITKLPLYYIYDDFPAKNWDIIIDYRRHSDTSTTTRHIYVSIAEDTTYPCNMYAYNYPYLGMVTIQEGAQYYVSLYKKVAVPNLPASNGGYIIEQVGETHSICSYTDNYRVYFKFIVAEIPALNLISIKMIDYNYNSGSKADFAVGALQMYAPM